MKVVDQKVTAKLARAYVHRRITEDSSCPTSNNSVKVPVFPHHKQSDRDDETRSWSSQSLNEYMTNGSFIST